MIKKLRHVGIVVSDLKKSLYFYKNILGLKIERSNREKSVYINTILGLSNGDVSTVKLSADDGNLIELLQYHTPLSAKEKKRRINAIGSAHTAFSVNDVFKEYQRLKKKGIRFLSTPQVSPNLYAQVVFCKDPDGNLVELVEVLQHHKR